jgi:putative spermidine/putrescine transport system permease protein
MSFTASQTLEFPPRGLSLRWYERLFGDAAWRESLLVSLRVGLGTVVVSLILGIPMAIGLTRRAFPGRNLVRALLIAPLAVPTIIFAIGAYFVWTVGWRLGPFQAGGGLTGTIEGLILAHTALAIPLVVILVSASLRTVDRTLELAAASLGANAPRTFREITLPLILPGIAAGAVLAFLTSWDETIVALFLTNAGIYTLPIRMFVGVRESVDPTVAAASTLLVAVTTLVFVSALLRQSRGSVGAWSE